MKRIQIAITDEQHSAAKLKITEQGLSWQKWGEAKIQEVISQNTDNWGIPLLEMAVDKQGFETKIQEKLIGALREHAFTILAKKNNKTKWVEHKENEVERLLMELLDIFELKTTGKWNKNKAALIAINYYQNLLKTFITKAENSYQRYYKETPSQTINVGDLMPFIDEITGILPKE